MKARRKSRFPHARLLALIVPLSLLLTSCGGDDEAAVPPTANSAFFVGDLEYQFDYQLDGLGRVDSYRISRRPGIQYPGELAADANVRECTGSLRGSYQCTSSNGGSMRGEAGRLVESQSGPGLTTAAYTYAYGSFGPVRVVRRWTGPQSHYSGETATTLGYDVAGKLDTVVEDSQTLQPACFLSSYSGAVTLASDGRMLNSQRTSFTPTPPPGVSNCTVMLGGPMLTEWAYGATGYMRQVVVSAFDIRGGLNAKSTTTYEADAAGWLVSRAVRFESGSEAPTQTDDAYSLVRDGGLIVEERFTQAEPSNFYKVRAAQRVRYEPGRRPAEPLFVPSVPTGLNGADYFGIISSHQR